MLFKTAVNNFLIYFIDFTAVDQEPIKTLQEVHLTAKDQIQEPMKTIQEVQQTAKDQMKEPVQIQENTSNLVIPTRRTMSVSQGEWLPVILNAVYIIHLKQLNVAVCRKDGELHK